MKAAIYARGASAQPDQHGACGAPGDQDTMSGAKANRLSLSSWPMPASCRFDGVLVWKLDRFGRLLVWLERRSSVRYAFGFLE